MATTLSRGDLAIIQVDSEDSDDPFVSGTQNMSLDTISFVLLADVTSGTQVFFTDRTWNGSSFSASGTDGTYTWTAGSDLAAGTVITITDAEMNAAGIELADTGEAIYAYQGTINTPSTFLFAVEFGDGNDTFNASLANTGLSVGNGAMAIAEDNSSYGERTWDQQRSLLFQQISDQANWNTNDNTPQVDQVEGTNLFVAPDVQLWIAGISGGHGIISVSGDATQNGGLGYDAQTYFQNTSNDGDSTTYTQRFWDPTHIVFDTVQGKFFVVDSSGSYDRILQGSISDLLTNTGTAPTMTILWQDSPAGTADGDGVTSIALDKANGDVYFTADNTLLRVDYNTANQTAVVLADLGLEADDGNKNFANELMLDLANGKAYIVNTETFDDFVESPPGSGNVIVATTTYQNSIIQVSNISPSDTDATGNTITELQFSGAYAESLNSATFAPDPGNFEDFYGKITDIDLNTTTGEFWFTAVQLNAGANGETGGIYKATLSGGTFTVTCIYSETNATDQNFLHINVDEETGYYYVSSQEPNGNHAIYRGSLSSVAGTAPTLYASLPNINDMTPEDISVESAPTLTGTALGATIVEQAGNPSPNPAAVTPANNFQASDLETASATHDQLAGAQVRISGNFQQGTDQLLYGGLLFGGSTNQNGVISLAGGDTVYFNYNASTGTLIFSGITTFNNYEAILAQVQFRADGDNPTNYGAAGTRTISYSTFDGLLYSDEVNATVTVTGVNDAPINVVGSAASVAEDTATNSITGVSIGDVDADPASQNVTVTLSVSHGTISLLTNVSGGIVGGDITGGSNGSSSITVTATQNEINATLAAAGGLTYTPGANFNGADQLHIVTNDNGFGGTGGAQSDTDDKVINISDVNDAPIIAGDGTESSATILEDTPFTNLTAPTVADLFAGQFSDPTDQQYDATTNPTGSVSDTFAGIIITTNNSSVSTGQWQYWNGVSWANIGTASSIAGVTLNAATPIRFNPVVDYNGAAPTLVAHLIETGGDPITDGAIIDPLANQAAHNAYTLGTVVLSQDITPVNDAPTSTGLSGDSVTFTEGDASVLLDAGSDATVADIDSANFDTGSLTVGISAGGQSGQDVLGIRNVGTGAGQIGVSGANVTYGGTTIGTFTGGSGGSNLVISFNASADTAAVAALLHNIQYSNTAGDTPLAGARTVAWTLVDGDGTANGGNDTLSLSTSLTIVAVDDPPVAYNDAVSAFENAVLNGDVTADNGSGADTDPDSALVVSQVNGSAGNVGSQFTLASGALLTVNSNGTFAYDPNGRFDYLISAAKAAATGAVNTTATDGFDYDLSGGNNAVVTITVNGVDGAGDELWGDATNNAITGTSTADFFRLSQGGDDTVNGGTGDDAFYMGAAFTSGDTLTGGGGFDQVGLQGNYGAPGTPLVLGPASFTDMDILVFLSGSDSRFGDTAGNLYSYYVTMDDGNVAAGQQLAVSWNKLGVGENVTFDGSAETDGSFITYGGQGNDTIIGSQQADGFYFGYGMWGAGDSVDGQAGTYDQLGLQGDYTAGGTGPIVFGASQLLNIDMIVCMTGGDARFGAPAGVGYSYDLTMDDANVAAGATMYISANTLRAAGGTLLSDETLTFDGSAEQDGTFVVYSGSGADTIVGGTGNDQIWGGDGADTMTGGSGNDSFHYGSATQSTAGAMDQILDFASGDTIDLSSIDAKPGGANDAFDFIGTAAFGSHAGELRAFEQSPGQWQVEADVDGDGTADLVIAVTTDHSLAVGDFVL